MVISRLHKKIFSKDLLLLSFRSEKRKNRKKHKNTKDGNLIVVTFRAASPSEDYHDSFSQKDIW